MRTGEFAYTRAALAIQALDSPSQTGMRIQARITLASAWATDEGSPGFIVVKSSTMQTARSPPR